MVFCLQNFLTYREKKISSDRQKLLKFKDLQTFWDHQNNCKGEERSEQFLKQNAFSIFSLRFFRSNTLHITIMIHKVHIFWEGYQILRNLHRSLDLTVTKWHKMEISQKFVAYSECMNFNWDFESFRKS